MTKPAESRLLRYGLGLLSVVLTLSIAMLFRRYSIGVDLGFLVVIVLIGVSWFGGAGPGLMVLVLFELVSIISTSQTQPDRVMTAKYIFAQLNVLALLTVLVLLISGRRKSDQRLREQREWLQVTLSSIGDAVIATNLDGLISFINPAAENLTGWAAAEATHKPLDEVFRVTGKDSYPKVKESDLEPSDSEDQPLGKVEDAILVSKDGAEKPVNYSKSPIRNRSGQTTGTVLVFRDVSERKQAAETLRRTEEQLLQAQKMEAVGRLAGGVAHDFNNLLTAIIGYSELTIYRLPANHVLREDLDEIRKAGERAATLTAQLLAFSRKQVLQPKILDLNSVVADTSKMLSRLIGADIRFRTTLDPKLKQVKADPGQIEQVLMNLAVNARDAMPDGGSLSIETANVYLDENYALHHTEVQAGPHIMLAVSDTGCGMDSETIAHIFEPFFTTKELGKGTGLGLATIYGIIKQSGGHIWVYSEVGKGTTFKIYLPQAEEEPSRMEEQMKPDLLPGGKECVLLAEDDGQVRVFARQVLQELGYRVIEATNGEEALIEANQATKGIDILLTDVIMPQMGGKELTERLKSERPEIKVLFLSGYTADAIVNHGVLDEGVAFLHKPFTPGELARKMREVLDVATIKM